MNKTSSLFPAGMRWYMLAACLAGVLLMAGLTFGMKATDQAVFCASCHAMAEQAWAHSQSVHAKLSCNECHTPDPLARKLVFKSAAGLRDAVHNSFMTVADVIHAEPNTKAVVQENCRRCHMVTISKVAMDSKPYCIDCHRSVPHTTRTPISQRMAGDV